MSTVHLFISSGRFSSFAEIRQFVDPLYTDDGDMVPSRFMSEIDLDAYEPAAIEVMHVRENRPVPLEEILQGVSYLEQWRQQVPAGKTADSALCVFAPNVPQAPARSSLEYVGSYDFQIVYPEWFKKILES